MFWNTKLFPSSPLKPIVPCFPADDGHFPLFLPYVVSFPLVADFRFGPPLRTSLCFPASLQTLHRISTASDDFPYNLKTFLVSQCALSVRQIFSLPFLTTTVRSLYSHRHLSLLGEKDIYHPRSGFVLRPREDRFPLISHNAGCRLPLPRGEGKEAFCLMRHPGPMRISSPPPPCCLERFAAPRCDVAHFFQEKTKFFFPLSIASIVAPALFPSLSLALSSRAPPARLPEM